LAESGRQAHGEDVEQERGDGGAAAGSAFGDPDGQRQGQEAGEREPAYGVEQGSLAFARGA
jgi:hypothetical protein